MKNRRDIFIIIGLFAALIAFVVLGPRAAPESLDFPTARSDAPEGALALYTWLDRLGYDARRLEYREFELADDDAALIVLNPSEPWTEPQVEQTLAWIERGGTLIFADDSSIVFGGADALFEEFDVGREVYSDTAIIERAPLTQPVFDQPPLTEALVRTGRVLIPQRDDYVKILGPDDAVVLASVSYGEGYVYLSAATYPFTNEGLRDPQNAALVLNILRRVPAGGRIQFDEYHHGFFAPPPPESVLLASPWGWATAYALAVVAMYLILTGRRFGRPVPLQEEVVRRSSAEYVESIADLLQRGNKRDYVLKQYRSRFKRRLARPYGINPQLDDQQFVQELARLRELDVSALPATLERLRKVPASEQELVQTVAASEAALKTLKGRQ